MDAKTTDESPGSVFSHPEYKRLTQFGYGDHDQWTRTFIVYLDLIESKGWADVQLCPAEKLQATVIRGRPSITKEIHYVLPTSVDSILSMSKLQATLSVVQELYETRTIDMAYVDSDSSIVYYSLSSSLVPPEPAEVQQAEERQRRKKQKRGQNFVAYKIK